jgi:hypothetical protein
LEERDFQDFLAAREEGGHYATFQTMREREREKEIEIERERERERETS